MEDSKKDRKVETFKVSTSKVQSVWELRQDNQQSVRTVGFVFGWKVGCSDFWDIVWAICTEHNKL